ALIASGIGGGYSGYFDVVPYRMGGLGIFSLASYIPDSGEITMNVWHRLISYILTFIIAFIITLVYEQRRELKAEKNIRPVEDGTRTSGNG
ncbi:PTS beta-glucoside transporter subunit EIIBCA, partial [Enterococcus faecium]|nr:PTS beta-glucoside transporter subunit EIIBCA [Enterococcus faecium]MCM6890016.1 PTS beta-glucoside transporter subunit EIIBCA [Enterococcus faecium]